MKTKLRYSLIIISTLIIGMVIGFLIGGRITSTRIENMRNYYTDNGFNHQFRKIIQPTPEQRAVIMPILKKHAVLNRQQMINFHEGQEEIFIDLIDELDTHLDEEQISRLTRALDQRNKRFHNSPKHRPRMDRRKKPTRE
ncbi:MAG: hypothetical protein QM503_00435 [Bacteroidota bacterium]